jgi:hypothetical protein
VIDVTCLSKWTAKGFPCGADLTRRAGNINLFNLSPAKELEERAISRNTYYTMDSFFFDNLSLLLLQKVETWSTVITPFNSSCDLSRD